MSSLCIWDSGKDVFWPCKNLEVLSFVYKPIPLRWQQNPEGGSIRAFPPTPGGHPGPGRIKDPHAARCQEAVPSGATRPRPGLSATVSAAAQVASPVSPESCRRSLAVVQVTRAPFQTVSHAPSDAASQSSDFHPFIFSQRCWLLASFNQLLGSISDVPGAFISGSSGPGRSWPEGTRVAALPSLHPFGGGGSLLVPQSVTGFLASKPSFPLPVKFLTREWDRARLRGAA